MNVSESRLSEPVFTSLLGFNNALTCAQPARYHSSLSAGFRNKCQHKMGNVCPCKQVAKHHTSTVFHRLVVVRSPKPPAVVKCFCCLNLDSAVSVVLFAAAQHVVSPGSGYVTEASGRLSDRLLGETARLLSGCVQPLLLHKLLPLTSSSTVWAAGRRGNDDRKGLQVQKRT